MDNNQTPVIELSFNDSFEPEVLQENKELQKDHDSVGGSLIGMLNDIIKEIINDVLGDDYDLSSVIRIASQNAANFVHLYDAYRNGGGKQMDVDYADIKPTINSIIMLDGDQNYVFGFASDDDEVQISYLFSALAVTAAKLLEPDEIDNVLGVFVSAVVDDLFEEDDDEEDDIVDIA